jgi:hypothetical protein
MTKPPPGVISHLKPYVQSRAILFYLRRYLATHAGERAVLCKAHRKATGRPLLKSTLWKHTGLKTNRAIEADTFLFYLEFLHRQRAIVADPKFFFRCAFPELLKAEAKR